MTKKIEVYKVVEIVHGGYRSALGAYLPRGFSRSYRIGRTTRQRGNCALLAFVSLTCALSFWRDLTQSAGLPYRQFVILRCRAEGGQLIDNLLTVDLSSTTRVKLRRFWADPYSVVRLWDKAPWGTIMCSAITPIAVSK